MLSPILGWELQPYKGNKIYSVWTLRLLVSWGLLPTIALCGCQAIRLLDHRQLPRGLWHDACNGILFNHESPLRGETFVIRKMTRAIVRISRNVPRALIGSVILFGIFIVIIQWGVMIGWGTARFVEMTKPGIELPGITLAKQFWGNAWGIAPRATARAIAAGAVNLKEGNGAIKITQPQ